MKNYSLRPSFRIYINGALKSCITNTNITYLCLLKKGDTVDLIHSSGDFEEFEVEKSDAYHFYLTKEGHIGLMNGGEYR